MEHTGGLFTSPFRRSRLIRPRSLLCSLQVLVHRLVWRLTVDWHPIMASSSNRAFPAWILPGVRVALR